MKECKMQQERTTPNREEISVLDFSEKKKKKSRCRKIEAFKREKKREREGRIDSRVRCQRFEKQKCGEKGERVRWVRNGGHLEEIKRAFW